MKRRHFIRNSLALVSLSLAGVGGFQAYQQYSLDYQQVVATEFLNEDDKLVLSVLIPVFSQGLSSQPSIEQTIVNIDQAILRLPLFTQDELRELFNLLSNGFGRMALAGVWLNWQKAQTSDIEDFLQSWRNHSLALLQQAYIGLHKLILGSIYSESEHWQSINYPGPLAISKH